MVTFTYLQLICLAWLLLLAWSVFIEPLWIELTVHEVSIPNLPPELEGLRVAFISDTHCGAWARRYHYDRAWHLLVPTEPDILLIGGDIVVNHARPNWSCDLRGLRDWNPPLGKFAVLGGHDRIFGPQRVQASLQALGITLLDNQSISFTRQGCTWWLTGLADNSDLPIETDATKALAGVPDGDTAIALVHSPDFVLAPEAARFSLVLSGHTHAGQVRLPWLGAILCVTELPRQHDHGLSLYKGIRLFVSRGLGCTVRLRLCCRPEVSLITLRGVSKDQQ
ncbi:metallophosphoesterase [bacterium]|nr:metallophosphoesterase [bacterium]